MSETTSSSDQPSGSQSAVLPQQGTSGISNDAKAMMAFDAAKKSVGVSYALWLFFSMLGGHRFYLARPGSGAAMLIFFIASFLLTFFVVGLFGFFILGIWAIVDAFLIPGMVRDYNQRLGERINSGMGS